MKYSDISMTPKTFINSLMKELNGNLKEKILMINKIWMEEVSDKTPRDVRTYVKEMRILTDELNKPKKKNIKKNLEEAEAILDEIEMKPSKPLPKPPMKPKQYSSVETTKPLPAIPKMSYKEFVKKMMPQLTGKASARMKEIGKLWQERKKQSGGMFLGKNKMLKF